MAASTVQLRNRLSQRGITLIEVVASLALLATLLVALLQTKTGATLRIASAKQKLAAVGVADQMLATWWAGSDHVPVPAEGTLPNDLAWRTRFVANTSARAMRCEVVRLEMFSTSRLDVPLVSVDLLQAPPNRSRSGSESKAK
jgi:Tfp pilus assembly protein PilV